MAQGGAALRGTWSTSIRLGVMGASVLAATGCASLERLSDGLAATLQGRVSRPIEYRLAGADPSIRRSLDLGLDSLRAGDHRKAVVVLNRAIWDLERLEKRSLRLEELAETYQALAHAYVGLQRVAWAQEQRQLGARLREAIGRDARGTWVQAMTRARAAYVAAHFKEALTGWRDALVDLEDVHDIVTRVRQVEVVRCYLALTHFALGDEERVRDELQRLVALDASVTRCAREAPPSVRVLISEVQKLSGGVN